MNACILNVTPDEYDQILQLNHDREVWNNQDEVLLHGLEALIGKELVDQIRRHEECRMRKHDTLEGITRVQEDAAERGTDGKVLVPSFGEHGTTVA
jgi:hypothetical protein